MKHRPPKDQQNPRSPAPRPAVRAPLLAVEGAAHAVISSVLAQRMPIVTPLRRAVFLGENRRHDSRRGRDHVQATV